MTCFKDNICAVSQFREFVLVYNIAVSAVSQVDSSDFHSHYQIIVLRHRSSARKMVTGQHVLQYEDENLLIRRWHAYIHASSYFTTKLYRIPHSWLTHAPRKDLKHDG